MTFEVIAKPRNTRKGIRLLLRSFVYFVYFVVHKEIVPKATVSLDYCAVTVIREPGAKKSRSSSRSLGAICWSSARSRSVTRAPGSFVTG